MNTQVRWGGGLLATLVFALALLVSRSEAGDSVVYRVNAGGPAVAGTSGTATWAADTVAKPSSYSNRTTIGNTVLSTAAAVSAGTTGVPASLFKDARVNQKTTANMKWSFPASPGEYQVNLYYAETNTANFAIGKHIFSTWLEGSPQVPEGGQVEDRLDVFKVAGSGNKGIVRSFQTTVFDATLDLEYTRHVNNPMVSAIEVKKIDLPGTWTKQRDANDARLEASLTQLNGKFYLAGGVTIDRTVLADQSEYDPNTGVWTAKAPLPEPLNHIQAVPLNGRIYYIGGLYTWPGPASAHVWIYDPLTDTFTEGAPMPRPRGAGGTAVYNNKIYYAGGLNDSTAVAWFDVYDPLLDTWKQLPNMPRAKDHFHAAVVGSRFYAIAGRNLEAADLITDNVAFDFATNKWITGLRPSPTRRGGFAAAALGDEVILIGGEIRQPAVAHRSVEAYNTVTNTWRTLAPMGMTQHGIQAAMCSNDIYIIGGSSRIGDIGANKVHQVLSLDDSLDPCTGILPTTSTPSTTTSSTTTTSTTTTTTTAPTTTTEPTTTVPP